MEQEIELNPAEKEHIEEVSNFIWFNNDVRILEESNHFTMRVFHIHFIQYIRKQTAFSDTEFMVEAEPISDIFSKIKRDEYVESVKFKLDSESNLSMESCDLSINQRLWSLSVDHKPVTTIGIEKPKGKSKHLIFEGEDYEHKRLRRLIKFHTQSFRCL
jgi:hypothetical protein